MDALKSYIGLSVGTGAVNSGLYINQLPGVSLDMMTGIVDDQTDLVGLWNEVENRGLLKFRLAVKTAINLSYKITDATVLSCLVTSGIDSFGLALWYFLGAELMVERTSSDRLNRYTTIDLEKAEKLKADFLIEFQAALSDAVDSLDINGSDCLSGCVEYSGTVRFIEQTP